MEKKSLISIQKAIKNFTPDDYDELIGLAKKEKAICIKKIEKEKKAAEILLGNMDDLLKNKSNLPSEFVKQLESLNGKKVLPVEIKNQSVRQEKDKKTAA